MKNLISMVQPGFSAVPKFVKTAYLPYTIGCLWAYAKTSDKVKDSYALNNIIFLRDDINSVTKKCKTDSVVCFSTYIWNSKYCDALAKQLKQNNPNCIIIYGGPEVPVSRSDLFKLKPWIDFVVLKEGEIIFQQLLEELVDNSFIISDQFQTKGLLINIDGKVHSTGWGPRINDLSNLPSPYGDDMFEQLVKNYPSIEWSAILETNRGCPFQCTFCDWGSLTYSKIKKFNLERVYNDIEWMGKNQVGFLTIADANFGIFLERDSLIADKILEIKQKYGFPYNWNITWAKNKQKQAQIDIVKKLANGGLTISTQSMSTTVLANIKRSNLNEHELVDIFRLCKKNNISMDTELIIGLPGETLISWKKGLFQVFDAGNDHGITIYQAQVLENTELNLIQREQYDIKTIKSFMDMSEDEEIDDLAEEIDLIISTKDIPLKDMKNLLLFNWFIITFHKHGYTTYAIKMLKKLYNISYDEFYTKFEQWLVTNSDWYKQELKITKKLINKMIGENTSFSYTIGDTFKVTGHKINFHSAVSIQYSKQTTKIINLVRQFIKETYPLEDDLLQELMQLTRDIIVTAETAESYPIIRTYKYNIYEYIYNFTDTLDSNTTYKFFFNWSKINNFSEKLYWGRRNEFSIAKVDIV